MNLDMIVLIYSSAPAAILLFFVAFSLRRTMRRLGGWAALKKLKKPNLVLSALCFIGSFLTIPFTIGALMLFLWISATASWEISNTLFFIALPVVAFIIMYSLLRIGLYLLEHPVNISGKWLIGAGIIVIGVIAISIIAGIIGPIVSPDRHDRFRRYFSQGKYELAIEELKKFEYRSYDDMVATYIRLGEFEKALTLVNEHIEKTKRYNSSHDLCLAYHTRAAVYYWRGDYRLAINDYNTIISLREKSLADKAAPWSKYESMISIANCRAKLGNYDGALEMYDSAEKLAEETDLHKKPRYAGSRKPDVKAILARGDSYLWREDFAKALENYNKAIDISGGSEDAFERRANLSALEGNYKSALEDINAAILACCGDKWKFTYEYNKYCRERAFLYNKLGMVKEAEKDNRHYAGFLRDRRRSSISITFREVERLTCNPGLIEPFDYITSR